MLSHVCALGMFGTGAAFACMACICQAIFLCLIVLGSEATKRAQEWLNVLHIRRRLKFSGGIGAQLAPLQANIARRHCITPLACIVHDDTWYNECRSAGLRVSSHGRTGQRCSNVPRGSGTACPASLSESDGAVEAEVEVTHDQARHAPRWCKWPAILFMVACDTLNVTLIRISMVNGSAAYLPSTAVFSVEVAKLLGCLTFLCLSGRLSPSSGYPSVFVASDVLKMSVPSLLYVVQGNLLYKAVDNLPVIAFQLLKQLKLLITAMLSILLLGKQLAPQQWSALILLICGVLTAQLSSIEPIQKSGAHFDRPLMGLAALLTAGMASSYAGVYFERVLKLEGGNGRRGGDRPTTMQTATRPCGDVDDDIEKGHGLLSRNIQLGLSSVPLAFMMLLAKDRNRIVANGGFFQGYTPLLWGIIFLQAAAGMLNSVIVKYTDTIVKGFASSYCILSSLVVEYFLFGFRPSAQFLAGSGIVILATLLYGGVIDLSGENNRACSKKNARSTTHRRKRFWKQ